MDKLRVFLGIPAGDSWARQLGSWVAALPTQTRDRNYPIRWVPPENLHLTLRFFGSVTQDDVVRITEKIAPITSARRSFVLQTKGLALFPNANRARVAAIELNDPSGELLQMEEAIRNETRQFGQLPEDRKFRAHVTFGRIKDPRALANVWRNAKPPELPPWPVLDLKLFMSQLSSSGSVYTPLATFLLPSVSPQA